MSSPFLHSTGLWPMLEHYLEKPNGSASKARVRVIRFLLTRRCDIMVNVAVNKVALNFTSEGCA